MSNNQKKTSGSQPKSKLYQIPQRRNQLQSIDSTRSVSTCPYVDVSVPITNATSTVTTIEFFDFIQTLLASFPQHATPTVYNRVGSQIPSIRSKIRIHYMDVDVSIVGAQSTALVAGDLYGTVRYAIVLDGLPYYGTGAVLPSPYLSSTMGGTDISDVEKVYVDRKVGLPSQAFDSANGYNVPMVVNQAFRIPVKRDFTFYSTNAGFTQYKTKNRNIHLDFVSDSGVTPHPTFSMLARVFFSFV